MLESPYLAIADMASALIDGSISVSIDFAIRSKPL